MAQGVVKRAFKYRFFPTDEQAALLTRTFGCVRKVYNLALAERDRMWRDERRRLRYGDTSALLTQWKRTEECACLQEVSCVPLQQALRHLQAAFTGFFDKRSKYPRFKSKKRSRASAEYTRSAFVYSDGRLSLAKMAEPLDIVWSRPLPTGAEPSTVTVSRDGAGRWFVSLLCEDASVGALAVVDTAVGIDMGLSSLLTLTHAVPGLTDEQGKVSDPRYAERDRERLAKVQRRLAKKTVGSKNHAKAARRVARVHARITDRRRDFLHRLTTRLVRENQTIVIEDLAVRSMVRNHSLARAISDTSWAELRRLLEYKCQWYGRVLVVVDRWHPSSKIRSACGTTKAHLALNERTFRCDNPACGLVLDRAVNAARNILAAGLAVTVCGDSGRPQRNSPGGQRSTKQKTQSVMAGVPGPARPGEGQTANSWNAMVFSTG
ncbi:RNA-guided endonuclease TnpB family protein [Streptomyces sp. NK15101]|uniref:RNA-guided endonuclease InsQ/TnpB family protein n=1 Tax=Streptomyces sp. NK15101 TaxID=2873261 RepID=UPI001CED9466|nr:RNA-guided endonuclease TnpB family protein [Streptomyces sp. NK15101]